MKALEHPREQESSRPPQRETRAAQQPRQRSLWLPIGIVVLLLVAMVFGILRHVQEGKAQRDFAAQNAKVAVNYVSVHPNAEPVHLTLPGSVQANQSITLYARTNGYVKKWLVDIGDNVKKGQLLAIIETPDVDQQLEQARGTLAQAQSNFEIARVTAQRWRDLADKKVVALQDNDEKQSAYEAAGAQVAADQAAVNQLEQLQGFNQITAPYDGRITQRHVDVGALVSAGSGSAGTPIYDLAAVDPLLIYVYVPQSDAPLVHDGITASLMVREMPGQAFRATVTRTAGAIDPTSRTLLTELEVPNPEGALYAGIYAEIEFALKDTKAPIMVPANAFLFRTQGPQVAVVGKGDKIHWQTISVGRDYGTQLEAIAGLENGTRLVTNPTDDLQEGMQVTAQPAPPTGGTTTGGASATGAGSPAGK